MNKLHNFYLLMIFAFALILTSCSTENSSQDLNIEKSTISVKLVDAPGDYDKVFVEVLDVHFLVIDDKTSPDCWLSLNAKNTGIYNLLDLTGGVEALLVDNLKIPSGTVYEIKLVLGNNNSIVIDGQTIPLAMPSFHQKGLSIRDVRNLEPNMDYEFILDFDVAKSILRTSTPDYIILKPVVRSNLEALSGSIQGKISTPNIQTQISIVSGGNSISTFTDYEGNFVLKAIPAGNYSITVKPDPSSGYSSKTLSDIKVTIGNISETGLIELR